VPCSQQVIGIAHAKFRVRSELKTRQKCAPRIAPEFSLPEFLFVLQDKFSFTQNTSEHQQCARCAQCWTPGRMGALMKDAEGWHHLLKLMHYWHDSQCHCQNHCRRLLSPILILQKGFMRLSNLFNVPEWGSSRSGTWVSLLGSRLHIAKLPYFF
jgi:hypothetical protein